MNETKQSYGNEEETCYQTEQKESEPLILNEIDIIKAIATKN